jgi:hypothetical protein
MKMSEIIKLFPYLRPGRCDGTLVRDGSTLRRVMPYLMPGRNSAAVYFTQEIDVTPTLAYLKRVNGPEKQNQQADAEAALRSVGKTERVTFFHLVLAACVKTLAQRPQLNRFVSGGGIYQRSAIQISFAVKKAYEDRAALTAVKVGFGPGDGLDAVVAKVNRVIRVGRGKQLTAAEKQMNVLGRLPRRVAGAVLRCEELLDRWNLLSPEIIAADPLFTSVFVANVGSLGFEAPFHHLYERGTASLFAAIGRVQQKNTAEGAQPGTRARGGRPAPEGTTASEGATGPGQKAKDTRHQRYGVTLRFTFDERVADGYYCARSLELFERLLRDPTRLE